MAELFNGGILGWGAGLLDSSGYLLTGRKWSELGQTIADSDGNHENELNFKDSIGTIQTVGNIGGAIAGGLGGWALGSKFGTVGKVIGGVGFALVGMKAGDIIAEVGEDAACATDYVQLGEKQGVKRNWFGAFGSNLMNFGDATYSGDNGITDAERAAASNAADPDVDM